MHASGIAAHRLLTVFGACSSLVAAPAAAQPVARFSLESVVEADEFAGTTASSRPQVDRRRLARGPLGDNWQIYVRPWFRLPRPKSRLPVPPWDKELYQAGVRYERRGPVAMRVDAGYILSPIGLGLYDVRPGHQPDDRAAPRVISRRCRRSIRPVRASRLSRRPIRSAHS